MLLNVVKINSICIFKFHEISIVPNKSMHTQYLSQYMGDTKLLTMTVIIAPTRPTTIRTTYYHTERCPSLKIEL